MIRKVANNLEDNVKDIDLEKENSEAEAEEPKEEGKEASDETTEAAEEKAEETEETVQEDAEENEKPDDKKGFFKKKDKKDKKDQQIEELTDKYRRVMAEFDNFRKRTEKEKSSMYEIGAKDIIVKLLPVVDNFERGLATVSEEEKEKPFADGMDKVYKQLTKMLEDAGVKEIEAEGKEFDPQYHNAVMHVDDESLGENIVAEVLQKGYTYKDSVVRHSMVKVAN
ncbi:MAG: nucleotide exchange factor GrpE [Butyrivibrio sp.]